MRALLCPASLKGVLTARDAAAALARGVRERRCRCGRAARSPTAAKGRAEALHAALGGEWREAIVSDPLGRPVSARWLLLPDGRAVVEAAAAIGLPLLADGERDPLVASSRGLGELVLARSAESAAGACSSGSAEARPSTAARACARCLRELPVPTTVLCDVTTTLADAARVFGPQKGASEEDVAILERRLAGDGRASAVRRAPGCRRRRGVSAPRSLLSEPSSCPARRRSSTSSASTSACASCELAITGEGQVDATTARGKAPGVVATRCAAAGVRCVVFGGRVTPSDRRRGDGQRSQATRRSAEADLVRARTALARLAASETRRPRGGRPSPRASSRRPAGAPRRTAGTRRPAVRTP